MTEEKRTNEDFYAVVSAIARFIETADSDKKDMREED